MAPMGNASGLIRLFLIRTSYSYRKETIMNKQNRLPMLAFAGALIALSGTLTPRALSLPPPSAGDSARATNVHVYVDSIKITGLDGAFQVDGRVWLTSSGSWTLNLFTKRVDGGNCDPKYGPAYFSGGPTTAHEFPISFTGNLDDNEKPGSFEFHGEIRGGLVSDMAIGVVPSVPSVFETFTFTPGALVKSAGLWTMDVNVQFKVNTNKTTLTSDAISTASRAWEGNPSVTAFPTLPGGTTYSYKTYQMSGTYIFPEPDPVLDPQNLGWCFYVSNPESKDPKKWWTGGLRSGSTLNFN